MFKNKIKTAAIGMFVALPIMLSLAPAELCAMNYLETVSSRSSFVARPSWSFSKSSLTNLVGRSFNKSNLFVHKHPFLTIGAFSLVSLGLVAGLPQI